MALLDQLIGTSGLGDAVAKVVGAFKLSPEAQLEFNKAIEEHKFELNQLQIQSDAKGVDDASANIQAEAHGNWYTAGARPTFMYVVEFILLWDYVIVPIWAKAHQPISLPDDLLVLFGTCICGYVGARTIEKIKGTN